MKFSFHGYVAERKALLPFYPDLSTECTQHLPKANLELHHFFFNASLTLVRMRGKYIFSILHLW